MCEYVVFGDKIKRKEEKNVPYFSSMLIIKRKHFHYSAEFMFCDLNDVSSIPHIEKKFHILRSSQEFTRDSQKSQSRCVRAIKPPFQKSKRNFVIHFPLHTYIKSNPKGKYLTSDWFRYVCFLQLIICFLLFAARYTLKSNQFWIKKRKIRQTKILFSHRKF